MNISNVLEVLESENLPTRIRCLAQALYVAMLALDRYGHTLSYDFKSEKGSDADKDRGLIARTALDDIRSIERRSLPTVSRLTQICMRRKLLPGGRLHRLRG